MNCRGGLFPAASILFLSSLPGSGLVIPFLIINRTIKPSADSAHLPSYASHSERSAAKSKNPTNVSRCDSRGSSTPFRQASTSLRMTRLCGLSYIGSTVRLFQRDGITPLSLKLRLHFSGKQRTATHQCGQSRALRTSAFQGWSLGTRPKTEFGNEGNTELRMKNERCCCSIFFKILHSTFSSPYQFLIHFAWVPEVDIDVLPAVDQRSKVGL